MDNIVHHLMTTQEFVATDAYRALGETGLVFVDGYHSEEQARFDHEAFRHLVPANGVVCFHDSIEVATVHIYGPGRAYERRVKFYLDTLKQDAAYQVVDFPFAHGLTLVRHA